jgi:predicted enzyme related to lactoylglutathione lyase
MSAQFSNVVYPVNDLAKAKALYESLLGVKPYADAPYYVGFRVGDYEVGLDPNGHRGLGPVGYYQVDDVATSLKALVDAGAETVQEPKDVGGGTLTAIVRDADGNITGIVQKP